MKKYKKTLSILLITLLFLGSVNFSTLIVMAEGQEVDIDKIYITRFYSSPETTHRYVLEVEGQNLTNTDFFVRSSEGQLIPLDDYERRTDTYVSIQMPRGQITGEIVTDVGKIPIGEQNMPLISGFEPVNARIKQNEELKISGSNFDTLNQDHEDYVKGIHINRSEFDLDDDKDNISISPKKIELSNIEELGIHNIQFLRNRKENFNNKDIEVEIRHFYTNAFQVYDDLNVSDEINMIPNQGVAGSRFRLEAEELLDTKNMSIFFIRDLEDPEFSERTKAESTNYISEVDEKDKFIANVPEGIGVGDYHVVLTNFVEEEPFNITREFILDEKFRVVEGGQQAGITRINPRRSPDIGTDAVIEGNNLSILSENLFEFDNGVSPEVETKSGRRELHFTYVNNDNSPIGTYYPFRDEDVKVFKIERKMTGIIGNDIRFKDSGHRITGPRNNEINIEVPRYDNLEGEEEIVDALLEIETTIHYTDENGDDQTLELIEEILLDDYFTFFPASYRPEITGIVPERIQVEDAGARHELKEEELFIRITGDNFMVTRFRDEDGSVITRRPVVFLGDDIIVNPNRDDLEGQDQQIQNIIDKSNPNLNFRVLDDNGIEVDGTEGNTLGTRIEFYLPKNHEIDGENIYSIDSNSVGELQDITVYNPTLDSMEYGLSESEANLFRFVEVLQPGLNPEILDVDPREISEDGGVDIRITGRNFGNDIRLFLNGDEIDIEVFPPNRIEFVAPPRDAGEYQLLVYNDEGGSDTANLLYLRSELSPEAIDFSPKEGTTRTPVTIVGKNFQRPDPGIDDINTQMRNLIGTRIYMDGRDINTYNEDDNGNIELRNYRFPQINGELVTPIIANQWNTRDIKLSDYAHSVVFVEDDSSNYHTLSYNNRGEILLTDGRNRNIIIDKAIDESGFKGFEDSTGQYRVKFDNTDNRTLTLIDTNNDNEFDLKAKTLYSFNDNNIITGDRVRIELANQENQNNNDQIVISVPNMGNPGTYDLEIVNPDTSKDGWYDNNGFRFITVPGSDPKIDDIFPDEGSEEGGIPVRISGKEFESTATRKARVFLDNVEVPSEDINISPDGTEIIFILPEFEGNLLQDYGVSRKPVRVLVQNSDGGYDYISDGFTYVSPNSEPEIEEILILPEGPASGGELHRIIGKDFMFYEPFESEDGLPFWEEGEIFTDLNRNQLWDDFRAFNGREELNKYLIYLYLMDEYEDAYQDIDEIEGDLIPTYDLFDDDKDIDLDSIYDATTEYLLGEGYESQEISEKQDDMFQKYVVPVLPRISFGGKDVEIIDFGRTAGNDYIDIVSPESEEGMVNVILTNRDSGRTPPFQYEYKRSTLNIRPTPNVASRTGGDIIHIHGDGTTEFFASNIKIYENSFVNKSIPLVRFSNLEGDDTLIGSNEADIDLDGGFKANYNGRSRTLKIEITDQDIVYSLLIEEYRGEDVFVSTRDLKSEDGVSFPDRRLDEGEESKDGVEELIRFFSDGNSFYVERGYASKVERVNQRQLEAVAPEYHTIEETNLIVINPDGGRGNSGFEYIFPDSKPRIEDIFKNLGTIDSLDDIEDYNRASTEIEDGKEVKIHRVTYSGGHTLSIYGEDFREGVSVILDGPDGNINIPADRIVRTEEDNLFGNTPETLYRLDFELPNVGEANLDNRMRLIVQNSDGGTATSDSLVPPIYLEFFRGQSNPVIEEVEPNEGSVMGGTRVSIKGEDFRETMEGFESGEFRVFFGREPVSPEDIEFIDYRNIEVIAPESKSYGEVNIVVENPDQTRFVLENGFNYISKPKINSVEPSFIFANDEDTFIDIKGEMFQAGLQIIIGGRKVHIDNTEDATVWGEGIIGTDSDGNNIYSKVIGGDEGVNLEFIDDGHIRVQFEENLDLENSSLIIINPDGGISEPFNNFDLMDPTPERPLVLEAIPGRSSSMMLVWSKSDQNVLNRASSFQVLGRKVGESSYNHITNTEGHEFLIRGLEPNTEYEFKVRALNEYGASEDYAEVRERTLSIYEDDELREKLENLDEEERKRRLEGEEIITGTSLRRIIGRDEISSFGPVYDIDFSSSQYRNIDEFIISFPISELNREFRDIKVSNGIFEYTFNPRALSVREAANINPQNINDAYVDIIIRRNNPSTRSRTGNLLAREYSLLSSVYEVDFQVAERGRTNNIRRLMSDTEFSLRHKSAVFPAENVYIGEYDFATDNINYLYEEGSIKIRSHKRVFLYGN